MQETLRHLDLAIEALRRNCPAHLMLRELEQCRSTLVKLDKGRRITPDMYAEWRESVSTSPCREVVSEEHAAGLAGPGTTIYPR